MDTPGFAVVAAAVVLFALFSRRLQSTIITPPIVFTAFGLVVGSAVLGWADLDFGDGLIHGLAEITLIFVLFSDASRIDLRRLRRDHNLSVRMLLIGMPLTIAAGLVVALFLPLGLSLWEAALLAAVLAPTDAALGQPRLHSPAHRGRQRGPDPNGARCLLPPPRQSHRQSKGSDGDSPQARRDLLQQSSLRHAVRGSWNAVLRAALSEARPGEPRAAREADGIRAHVEPSCRGWSFLGMLWTELTRAPLTSSAPAPAAPRAPSRRSRRRGGGLRGGGARGRPRRPRVARASRARHRSAAGSSGRP